MAKLVNGRVTEKYFGPIDIKNGQATTYYFLGNRRVAEKDPSGQISYYHQDHLGSTSLITNQEGQEVRWQEYYEFGAL